MFALLLSQDTEVIQTKTSLVFTQHQFTEYARLSGDNNPIHVDPIFAAGTRFRRTVAHGMHLFALLQRGIAATSTSPVRLQTQEFMFRAPTFTGEALQMTIREQDDGTIHEEITGPSGAIAVTGTARLGDPKGTPPPGSAITESEAYEGLQVGMAATRSRLYTSADIDGYSRLVNDPNPLFAGATPELPPGLLGGMVSWVLGVDLPGPGTNWLKQSFRFHRIVHVPAEVTTTATITRIRPDKGLVNLSNTCTVDGEAVVSGDSLVLAVDLARR